MIERYHDYNFNINSNKYKIKYQNILCFKPSASCKNLLSLYFLFGCLLLWSLFFWCILLWCIIFLLWFLRNRFRSLGKLLDLVLAPGAET